MTYSHIPHWVRNELAHWGSTNVAVLIMVVNMNLRTNLSLRKIVVRGLVSKISTSILEYNRMVRSLQHHKVWLLKQKLIEPVKANYQVLSYRSRYQGTDKLYCSKIYVHARRFMSSLFEIRCQLPNNPCGLILLGSVSTNHRYSSHLQVIECPDKRTVSWTKEMEPLSEWGVHFRTPSLQLLRGSQMFKTCGEGRKESLLFLRYMCKKK